jgi:GR25 family glycosyltransferase involved in LPS biosynthesis
MFSFNRNNTFCISLLSNKERAEKMQNRFQKLHMDVTIWPASTPETITSTFVYYLNKENRACSQSHFNVWKHIVEKKIDYAMILEDDACFDKSFFEKLQQFNNDINDNEWDAIFLNASEPIEIVNKWIQVQEQYLAGGYILSLGGANKLLSMFQNELFAADWMTSRLQVYNHSYSYFPWLIIQEGKETTIGSNVDADHKKVLRCLNEIAYSIDNYII